MVLGLDYVEMMQEMWKKEKDLEGFEGVISLTSDWLIHPTFYPHSLLISPSLAYLDF